MFSPFYYDYLVTFFSLLPYLLVLLKALVICSEKTLAAIAFALCFTVASFIGFSWLQSFTFIGNILCLLLSFSMMSKDGK